MTVNRSSVTGFTLPRGKLLCAIAVSCALASCADDGHTAAVGLQTPSPALVRGAALYSGSCSDFCHGRGPSAIDVVTTTLAATAAGRASDTPDLFDCAWLTTKSDSEIEQVIIAGIADTRMVGFGSNFPEGIRDHAALIGYLRMASACETQSYSEE